MSNSEMEIKVSRVILKVLGIIELIGAILFVILAIMIPLASNGADLASAMGISGTEGVSATTITLLIVFTFISLLFMSITDITTDSFGWSSFLSDFFDFLILFSAVTVRKADK